jgi:hypothetical protein
LRRGKKIFFCDSFLCGHLVCSICCYKLVWFTCIIV